MKKSTDRIKRFKKAYSEFKNKTDNEILLYLNFHKNLKNEINKKLLKMPSGKRN